MNYPSFGKPTSREYVTLGAVGALNVRGRGLQPNSATPTREKGYISTEGFVTGPAFLNVDIFEVL